MSRASSVTLSFLVGAGIGVIVGILMAPKAGEETREDVKEKLNTMKLKVDNLYEKSIEKTNEIVSKSEGISSDVCSSDLEDFTFQINTMAVSLAVIAFVVVAFLLVVIIFMFLFYFRFANKLDKILRDINIHSEKCNVLLDLVTDEVSRAKDQIDGVYYSINAITDKVLRFSSFVQDFKVPNFIKALFALFSTKKYDSRDTEQINTESIRTKSKRKFDSTTDDDFDF